MGHIICGLFSSSGFVGSPKNIYGATGRNAWKSTSEDIANDI
jgi:hypothetical protein